MISPTESLPKLYPPDYTGNRVSTSGVDVMKRSLLDEFLYGIDFDFT
jgi:hypothetical protein